MTATYGPNQLHPDDVVFFLEVSAAMRRVAKKYDLPLRSITPLPMPESGLADRLGDCSASGEIRLVMRATVNGAWCEHPRSPESVWNTAAHELSHLRYMNHGVQFNEFWSELHLALRNQQEDHRDKIIGKLVKMQAQKEGEAAIGNTEAAEAFASAINRMLLEYELNPSEIDYARTADRDPVIEVRVDLTRYHIESEKRRIAWQEALARIVARAHLCQFLIRPGSNDIYFVGTKSHAMVAEYVYGCLVPAAQIMSKQERRRFRRGQKKVHGFAKDCAGFTASWLNAFIGRLEERFEEARKAAVAAAIPADAPAGSHSQALMRLDGALIKAQQYVNDKFKAKRSVSALAMRHGRHAEGARRGREAANAMTLGRKGVTSGSTQKLIGG